MADFRMPSLSADMVVGQLTEWNKRPGDALARGDIIAVVETQKGAIEIEAYEEGVLDRILVEVGTRVPVGTPLAIVRALDDAPSDAPDQDPDDGPVDVPIDAPDEEPADASIDAAPARPKFELVPAAPAASQASLVPRPASPAARRRAHDAGIALDTLVGSGPGAAVVLADVEREITRASRPAAPMTDSGNAPLDGMRKAIARAITRSKREIPHYYLAHTIDLDAATHRVAMTNAARAPAERLVLGALFIGAVARAARAHPRFNGYWQDDEFVPSDAVHVGMAIRLRGGGLVAPAIHDADTLDDDALMVKLRDLILRVRERRFRQGELTDPTLTVSSLGERGVRSLYGVIHPPQVCLIGFGSPRDACRIIDGAPIARRVVEVTLAADHRASDGHTGARFLVDIAQDLETPVKTPTHSQESAHAHD